MNEFMKIVLSLSCSGALLVMLIAVMKFLLHRKSSMRWQYDIWLIATLRFVLPLTFGNTLTGNLFRIFDTENIYDHGILSNIPATVNVLPADVTAVAAGRQILKVFYGSPFFAESGIFLVWFAVMLVIFIRKITTYQDYVRYIRAGSTEVSDIQMLNLLSDCQEQLKIREIVELYRNPLLVSPIMTGFFRPRIILPARPVPPDKISYIFTHELIHYKRKDLFYKWFVQIVLCIHWFNPVAYLLAKEVNRACELACDEAVAVSLDDRGRKEYGDTLLLFLRTDRGSGDSLTFVTLTEGAEQLKERLGAIMKPRKKSKIVTAVSFLATAVIGICFAASGAYAAPADANSETEIAGSEVVEEEYYWGSYVIGVAWNWDACMNGGTETDKPDETGIQDQDTAVRTLYFADSVGSTVNDIKAVNAAEALIQHLRSMNTVPEMRNPLITRLDYVDVKDVAAMNGIITKF